MSVYDFSPHVNTDGAPTATNNGTRSNNQDRDLLNDMLDMGDGARIQQDRVFKPLSLPDLLNRPPKQWLIEQVLGAGDIGMVYGPPGSGKTFTIVDLTFAACLGKQWAMRFNVVRPLTVAYCAGEGISGLPDRFAAAAEFYGVTELPNLFFFENVPQLFTDTPTNTISIRRFIDDWKAGRAANELPHLDLLVIDTLHTATAGADENSAQDMGRVLQAVKLAVKELGCAVLVVHHTNKSGNGERGSSALRGAMDFMLKVEAAGSKYQLHCEKLKDGERWKDQTYDLVTVSNVDSVRVWWDEPAEGKKAAGKEGHYRKAMLDEMMSAPGRRLTKNKLAEVAGVTPEHASKILAAMVTSGDCRRALEDDSKQPSKSNPYIYYVGDQEHDNHIHNRSYS
jgi:hypothetical protein